MPISPSCLHAYKWRPRTTVSDRNRHLTCLISSKEMENTVSELHRKVKDLFVVAKGEKMLQYSKLRWNPCRQLKC